MHSIHGLTVSGVADEEAAHAPGGVGIKGVNSI